VPRPSPLAAETMRRRSIVGVSAGIGALGATFAYFFHPRKGAVRREAAVRSGRRLVGGESEVATVGHPLRGRSGRRAGALRARLEEALIEALGAEGMALWVLVDGSTVAVRGEVSSLDQITRVSQVIAEVGGGAEVENLVRLRSTPRVVAS
jgi:osmotically-inducible protein OsmY